MRREPDFFGEQELALVYVAKKLKDALRLEKLFTEVGLDYLVETDKYRGGIIFQTERVGAFFYVAPENESAAKKNMSREGFAPYEVSA